MKGPVHYAPIGSRGECGSTEGRFTMIYARVTCQKCWDKMRKAAKR